MVTFKANIEQVSYIKVHCILIAKPLVDEIGGMKQRVWCEVNKQLKFRAGFVGAGNGQAYISINNERLKALNLKLGDEVDITLTQDNSAYGTTMPEEMEILLAQEPEANTYFKNLTPGMKRFLLNHVNGVKSLDKRAERAAIIIQNLLIVKTGKVSYGDLIKRQ